MRANVLDEEGTDPAALEAERLALEDAAQLYRAVIWGAVLAVMVLWGSFLCWAGWHLHGWVAR